MPTRVHRFTGVLVTGSLVALAALGLRGCPPDGTAPHQVESRVTRGGQLIAAISREPQSFNPLVESDESSDLLGTLMQGRLLRVNPSTFELEPWLASGWESSGDGLTHVVHLRPGVVWSDRTRFTSADVVFSAQAAYDASTRSAVAGRLLVGGEPIQVTAADDSTVVVTFAAPSGSGLRPLAWLPILPRHKLEGDLVAGKLAEAWDIHTPAVSLVGLGPFILRAYEPGRRIVLDRNPWYWRTGSDGKSLPYVDSLALEIVPDGGAELARLQAGDLDLPHGALQGGEYLAARRIEAEGRLQITELGIGLDADAFWFCLKPEIWKADPRFGFVQKPEFRQAISHAVDREAFARAVLHAEAVPIWGPITPGNRPWFTPNLPRYPYDLTRARQLLSGIGLEDRNGDGVVETVGGVAAHFTVLTKLGAGDEERGVAELRARLAAIGVALDIVPVDAGVLATRLSTCDYEAVYTRPRRTSDVDPSGNLDLWLSSGPAHVWNPGERVPATEWEGRLDGLLLQQATELDPARRREVFVESQRIWAENLPVLYFAAPRLHYAHSRRVGGVIPAVSGPPALWNADALSLAPSP